jgi:hypothetical protein
MKILLINQSFVSPEEPGHTRHFEMAQYLRKHGHELVIVGSDINYQTGRQTTKRRRIFESVEEHRWYTDPACLRVSIAASQLFLADRFLF